MSCRLAKAVQPHKEVLDSVTCPLTPQCPKFPPLQGTWTVHLSAVFLKLYRKPGAEERGGHRCENQVVAELGTQYLGSNTERERRSRPNGPAKGEPKTGGKQQWLSWKQGHNINMRKHSKNQSARRQISVYNYVAKVWGIEGGGSLISFGCRYCNVLKF